MLSKKYMSNINIQSKHNIIARHIAEIDLNELKSLIREDNFMPLGKIRTIPKAWTDRYYIHNIVAMMKKKVTVWFVGAYKNNLLCGLGILEETKWETSYFGIKMARVVYLLSTQRCGDTYDIKRKILHEIIKFSFIRGFRHLCLEIDSDDHAGIYAAEINGFHLIVTHLMYASERSKVYTNRKQQMPRGWIIRQFNKKDTPTLLKITEQTEVMNRYLADPKLPRKKAKRYFLEKTKNCCLGKLSAQIDVLEKDKEILGFAIRRYERISKDCSYAFALWAAVSPEIQRQNIATRFIKETQRNVLKKVDFILGRVHIGNVPMIKMLSKLNAEFITGIHTFHKWL